MERQAAANELWGPDSEAVVNAKKTCSQWKEWQSNCFENWWHPPELVKNETLRRQFCEKMKAEPGEGIMHFQDDSGI